MEALTIYSKQGRALAKAVKVLEAMARLEPGPEERPVGSDVVDRSRRQVQRRLGEEERARLVALYVAGASANEMARQFGIHKETVYGIVDAAGVRRRARRKLTAEDVAEVERLRAEGLSYLAIGQHFGVAAETVRRHLLSRLDRGGSSSRSDG